MSEKFSGKIKFAIPLILAVLIVLLSANPGFAAYGEWENDPVTDDRYEDTFNVSTIGTGKILTDKSVDENFLNGGGVAI